MSKFNLEEHESFIVGSSDDIKSAVMVMADRIRSLEGENQYLTRALNPKCSGEFANEVNDLGWKSHPILEKYDIKVDGFVFNNLKPILCDIINEYGKLILSKARVCCLN